MCPFRQFIRQPYVNRKSLARFEPATRRPLEQRSGTKPTEPPHAADKQVLYHHRLRFEPAPIFR